MGAWSDVLRPHVLDFSIPLTPGRNICQITLNPTLKVTKWLSENEIETVAESAVVAMETLDTNAKAIEDAILRLRQL